MGLFIKDYKETEPNKFVFYVSKTDGNCYIDISEKEENIFEVDIYFDDEITPMSAWNLAACANTCHRILKNWLQNNSPKKAYLTTRGSRVGPYLPFLKPFCIPLIPKQYDFDIQEQSSFTEFSIIHH